MANILSNLLVLNKVLPTLTESEILDLLIEERDGKGRADVVIRLHQRYNKLRVLRERQELINELGKNNS